MIDRIKNFFSGLKPLVLGWLCLLCCYLQAHESEHKPSADETRAEQNPVEQIAGDKAQWQGKLEAGFIATTGNSEAKVFNGVFNAVRVIEQWIQAIIIKAAGSAFNGSRSAKLYSADGTVKYDLLDNIFFFANLRYFDDKFDSFNESIAAVGVAGFKPMASDKLSWDIFFGVGYSRQSLQVTAEDISGMTFVGISRYSHQPSPSTGLDFISRFEYKPENTFAGNEASVDVAINSILALGPAYEFRYNSGPASTDDNLGTVTKANIVYTF